MSEDEILAQLRDIHLPSDVGIETPVDIAVWPFLLLGAVVALILAIRYLGRNRWRRAAKRELAQILSVEDPHAQWSMLLAFSTTLSARAGRQVVLPNVAFLRPDDIGGDERAAFVSYLGAELGR